MGPHWGARSRPSCRLSEILATSALRGWIRYARVVGAAGQAQAIHKRLVGGQTPNTSFQRTSGLACGQPCRR